MELKYIMMYCKETTRFIPFLFPNNVAHISMVQATRSLPENLCMGTFWTLSSAGFIDMLTLKCYGESESCRQYFPGNYKSNGTIDSEIIKLYQWQHGIYDSFTAELLKNQLKKRGIDV